MFTHFEVRIIDLERRVFNSEVLFIKNKGLPVKFRSVGPHEQPALFVYKPRQTLDILRHHLFGRISGQLRPGGYLRGGLKYQSDCAFPVFLGHAAYESGGP